MSMLTRIVSGVVANVATTVQRQQRKKKKQRPRFRYGLNKQQQRQRQRRQREIIEELMQTLTEIRELLEQSGLNPRKQFGQNFMIDHNLMGKLLELADILPGVPVLEVGPGTGSLTEELLQRASKVVAAEIDRGLAEMLRGRLTQPNFRLVLGDILADKRHIAPAVLTELGPEAQMVANLPYNIATPLVAQCLQDSWAVACRPGAAEGLTCFRRLTFSVQREVADRFVAGYGSEAYGPVSVVVSLLSTARAGAHLPATAFWPRPAVESRMVRMDFDLAKARLVKDVSVLNGVLALSFGQRRKQLGSIFRKNATFAPEALAAAAGQSGIDLTSRAEDISAETFLKFSNILADL